MLRIKNYVRPQTLEEAYALCQKRGSVVLGGMLWLKMESRSVETAIDLQDLGLGEITETEEGWSIGAMVSLRQLEQHPGLSALTHGAMAESLRHIVGVQFRNTATVGGSLYGRFGFSDVCTLFLALDARVELFSGGLLPLEEFFRQSRASRDLLVRVLVPKVPRRVVYLSQRRSATDFPVLTCAVSQTAEGPLCCAMGARPGLAALLTGLPEDPEEAGRRAAEGFSFGSNLRAGADFRTRIAEVLVRRAVLALQQQEVSTWKSN